MNWKNLRAFCVIFAIALGVYFFRLGTIPLLDPDEPRYARAAVEMMETGDWINPQLNEQNRWDKPVLFYWLILWSYNFFGVSEWSARLPSALFALLSALLLFIWAVRNNKYRVGGLASLILITNLQFAVVGRLAITDMALCFFRSLALIFAFESWRSGRGRLILFSYVAVALAFLTKGPVGVVLPAFIFFVFLAFSGNLSYLKQIRLGSGLLVFSLIAFPWYIVEGILYKDFFQYFFVLHNVKRFATDALKHTEPFYYYLVVLFGGFFPWSLFLPRTLWGAFRNYWKDPFYFFLLLWAGLELAFFSFSKAKIPTYILSVFLPLSLLVGRCWETLFEREGKPCRVWIEGVLVVLFSLGALGIGTYFWFQEFPWGWKSLLVCALPVVVGFITLLIFAVRSRLRSMFGALVCSFIVGFLAFIQFMGADLGETRSMRELALEVIHKERGSPSKVASFKIFKPSFIYYLGRPIQRIDDFDELSLFMQGPEEAFCVMRAETFELLHKQASIPPLYLIKQTSDKVVVTNHRLKRLTGLAREV